MSSHEDLRFSLFLEGGIALGIWELDGDYRSRRSTSAAWLDVGPVVFAQAAIRWLWRCDIYCIYVQWYIQNHDSIRLQIYLYTTVCQALQHSIRQ